MTLWKACIISRIKVDRDKRTAQNCSYAGSRWIAHVMAQSGRFKLTDRACNFFSSKAIELFAFKYYNIDRRKSGIGHSYCCRESSNRQECFHSWVCRSQKILCCRYSFMQAYFGGKMQSRNQILLTRKTLPGVMLPAVAYCAFGARILPSTGPQDVENVDLSASFR